METKEKEKDVNLNKNFLGLNQINSEIKFDTLYDVKTKKFPKQIYDYYKVLSINELQLPNKKILTCQKYIKYFGEKKEDKLIEDTKIIIQLEDIWAQTLLYKNDNIFVSAQYDNIQKKYVVKVNRINNKTKNYYGIVKEFLKGFIIVNPDIYINSTQIKYCKKCVRNAFFYGTIRNIFDSDYTILTLVGIAVHELFEELLSYIKRDSKNFEEDDSMYTVYLKLFKEKHALEILKKIIKKEDYKYQSSFINITEETLTKECEPFINSIQKFFEDYVLNYKKLKKL